MINELIKFIEDFGFVKNIVINNSNFIKTDYILKNYFVTITHNLEINKYKINYGVFKIDEKYDEIIDIDNFYFNDFITIFCFEIDKLSIEHQSMFKLFKNYILNNDNLKSENRKFKIKKLDL